MSSDLFSTIARVNPTLHGWCSDQRAAEFAAIVVALRPAVTCIIGVWGGRDTIAAALAHRSVGSGKVVAIDPWSAPASVAGQVDPRDREWWASQENHELVYKSFLRNLNDLGIGPEWVDVRRATSDAVEPPQEIGLLSVDGNHGEQAVRDVERYARNVRIGGIVYMDDLKWAGGAVIEAVDRLLKLGFVELYKRDSGAFFQRVSR